MLPRESIGQARDKAAARAIFHAGPANFGADSLLGGFRPVYDGGVDTAHENHAPGELLLYLRYVVLGPARPARCLSPNSTMSSTMGSRKESE